jgi:diguanylate cyclase (GGDEF)-like protein
MNIDNLHPLIRRQLKRLAESGEISISTLPEVLLTTISEAYVRADDDRKRFEHSIRLSNRDLEERYELLEKQHQKLEESKIQLERSHALLMDTLNATNDAIVVFDRRGHVVITNEQFIELFGLEQHASSLKRTVIRQSLKMRVGNFDELTKVWNFNKQHPTESSYCLLELVNGKFVECVTNPRLFQDQVIGRVWSFNDVTAIKRNERLAIHNSNHDPLTGLPNRNLLTEWLKREVSRDIKKQKSTAVLFIGVDGFKAINDTQGVEFGDQLLCLISQRLKNAARGASLARHGGDEFVILTENTGSTHEISQLSEDILRQLSQPFTLNDQAIHISVSIGIALFPIDGQNPESLLRKSNIAMFHAKQKGRNNFQFFAERLEQAAHRRLQLRNDLRRALQNNEFRLVYQPKIDFENRLIRGAEALIRWIPENGHPVSPADFIPAAEENGFIVEIGEWVINEVGRQMAEWRDKGTICPVSLNISTKHFRSGNLVSSMRKMLKNYDLEPSLIEVEVTESACMEDLPKTIAALSSLRDIGFKCSIDDFGTGFSSLGYLLALPIDVLKIDKVFIDNATQSRKQQALIKTIVDLAHTLELIVVAEGIEDLPTAELLRGLSCDLAQGYYFSRPLKPDDFYRIFRAGRPLPE